MKNLLLLGATGLVGQQALKLCKYHLDVSRVVAPTRRALEAHAKLENPIVNFDQLPEDAQWWKADAVICTLGTTLKQAGSKIAFRLVDHDYVLSGARLAYRAGTKTFVLNSALGANPEARSFYLKTKGEIELALKAIGFESLTIVRPSLLVGSPRPDSRPAESAAIFIAKLLAPVLPKRIRVVPVQSIAAIMLDAALLANRGTRIIESEELQH